jgi:hypothetical protein
MALGNLSITVNAGISRFVTSMDTASRAAKAMSASMEAANDAIVSGSEQSAEAIGTIQQAADDIDFSSTSEKFAAAFGAGVGAGASAVDKAIDGFKSYVKTKLVITGIALLAGVSAAALSAVYLTYKVIKESLGFIAGLFTGDSYKSESIDALVKTNDQVKELQNSLNLTAQQASATNAAIAAIGISKSDYTSVFSSAAGAIRNNTDELQCSV